MTQSEPRIVTPQEAQRVHAEDITFTLGLDLAHTVATESDRIEFARAAGVVSGWSDAMSTEPDRTRAAVVKALRDVARSCGVCGSTSTRNALRRRADAIENGADL